MTKLRVSVHASFSVKYYFWYFIDAWLEIIDLEKSAGDVSQTSVLYSQAIKRLDGGLVEEFINRQAIRAVQKPGK